MGFRTNPTRSFEGITPEQFARWYPKDRPPTSSPFEIGLVLAGAVSAGAYTAGVMDFLFEALDAWHGAKDAGEAVPQHAVRLKIMTGASAGGMNAAIAAVACRSDFPHITAANHRAQGSQNPFYDAWVRRIDIRDLLDTGDIAKGRPARSVLNCATLDRIIEAVLGYRGAPARRAWLDDPFQVVLTLTNLSGVPYAVRFEGETKLYHEMVMHRDDIRFGVPVFDAIAGDAVAPDVIRLDPEVSAGDDGWSALGTSALATGAFPMALAPRRILRQPTDYEYRFAYVNSEGRHIYAKPWPEGGDDPYAFFSVDGGAMNNEPFEIARSFLSGSQEKNPRKGLEACRAVVMIDPFTDHGQPAAMSEAALPQILMRLFGAYKQQARFNQIDLSLAEANDVYSRFLIAPSRAGKRGAAAMASGGLGGFLGFFDETLRHHDFLLGRANCQRFLRDWFVLPEDNVVISSGGTPPEVLQNETFRSRAKGREGHVQIIPLVGGLDADQPLPDWAALRFDGYAPLEKAVEARVDAVYKAVRDDMLANVPGGALGRGFARAYVYPVWHVVRRKLLNAAKQHIDGAAAQIRRG